MNFVWFLVASVCFYLFFWYILSMIIFLPSMPVMGLLNYLIEHPQKKWTKIALPPIFVLAFLLGTFLPTALFGMGMGVIALHFAENASWPLIYFLIAGFGAFTVSAPSGESSIFGMLISLGTYVITVTVTRFALLAEVTIDLIMNIASGILILLLFAGIVWWVVLFLDDKVSKKSEIELKTQQEIKKKLSVGVYVLSILFVMLGGLWILSYLTNPVIEMSGYFIWGIPYLVGGIGMLCRKYWALRLSQVFLIISALPVIGLFIYALFQPQKPPFFVILLLLVFAVIVWGLPIWFLFRKSTVRQFIKGKIDKDRQIVENFRGTLKKHIDQLFGIRLYYEGIKYTFGNDDITMKITTQHFENIVERGEKMVSGASELLRKVQEGEINAKALENFEFLPISDYPELDDMTIRAKLLVEAYEKLFPERPREIPLTQDEHQQLIIEAVDHYTQG